MGNRSVKKLCIAMIYLIPVIIFIGTLSKMYKVFWNVNACMSDYYLAGDGQFHLIPLCGYFVYIYGQCDDVQKGRSAVPVFT